MGVRIHPDFVCVGNVLHDKALGASYRLSDDAVWLLGVLHQEPHLSSVVRTVMDQRAQTHGAATAAVCSFYAQLRQVGGLLPMWRGSLGARLRLWLSWRVRDPATTKGFMRAVLRAFGLPIVGALAISWLLRIPVLLPLLVVASCVMHEVGHVLVARFSRIPTVILSHPGYMALAYVPRRWSAIIAGAGPLLAVLFCAVAGIFTTNPVVRFGVVATGLCHLLTIGPWSADGRTIWRYYDRQTRTLDPTQSDGSPRTFSINN